MISALAPAPPTPADMLDQARARLARLETELANYPAPLAVAAASGDFDAIAAVLRRRRELPDLLNAARLVLYHCERSALQAEIAALRPQAGAVVERSNQARAAVEGIDRHRNPAAYEQAGDTLKRTEAERGRLGATLDGLKRSEVAAEQRFNALLAELARRP